jgi:hypothetical protein
MVVGSATVTRRSRIGFRVDPGKVLQLAKNERLSPPWCSSLVQQLLAGLSLIGFVQSEIFGGGGLSG